MGDGLETAVDRLESYGPAALALGLGVPVPAGTSDEASRRGPRARGNLVHGKGQEDMAIRHAEAQWSGDLREGQGTMKLGSGAFEGPYSFRSRMEEGTGTNPEELIGAAHAGCFSMALSAQLGQEGFPPTRIHTTADVHFGPVGQGFAITRIDLHTQAEVPGIDEATFRQQAQAAKENCPVSKALAGTEITLDAALVQGS